MEIHCYRRLGACFIVALICLNLHAAAPAATLLRFEFDQADGSFTAVPTLLAEGLTASWNDDAGLLTDLAGVSGRALAASGFTAGNALHLAIELAPGLSLVAEQLSVTLRASASGPNSWQLATGGVLQSSGAATAQFRTFDIALALAPANGSMRFDLLGLGATAASGTLRIDNVQLLGQLTAVALPGPLFLVAMPLAGLAAGRWRRRPVHGAT